VQACAAACRDLANQVVQKPALRLRLPEDEASTAGLIKHDQVNAVGEAGEVLLVWFQPNLASRPAVVEDQSRCGGQLTDSFPEEKAGAIFPVPEHLKELLAIIPRWRAGQQPALRIARLVDPKQIGLEPCQEVLGFLRIECRRDLQVI
jgi:hypothetical protein